eukprot:TRINITY_DN2640_c0_g1_i1.p2 TRINITY_DN2640_c0_g1~~TRINITY_DN2640_c0_g1_i1.p2  ORF type:complete len:722 (+),score=93.15 TRINITY_DN2640_c0_g1_i1:6000-8165(+)
MLHQSQKLHLTFKKKSNQMEAKKKKFEKELKSKIQQKLKGKETEESFLTKAFKFMDITGSGKVNFDQFSGAIGRMGFALEKPVPQFHAYSYQDLQSLFVLYDSNNDGFIDYREFCGELFGTPESRPATAPTQKDIRADKLVDMFRKKVNERGAKGIMGLIKCFKDVDKDKSGTLSQDEFKMAMKEYKLGIDDGDLEVIFKEFDKDRDSLISQEEFLRTIRGEMNEYRKRIVNAVFDVLDTNKTGIINIGETKKKYSGAKHPAVLAGRKTDSQVVDDLATALDLYQNCYELKDGTMTREEFIEFYNNVSASIDSDTYFEEMMKNCWGLKPEQLKATAEPLTEEIKEKEAVPVVEQKEQPSPMAVPPSTVPIAPAVVEEEKYIPPPDTPARRFRDSVVSRGVRGILGLERQFKVYTKAGLLELNDLKKAVEDFRLHVDVEDLEVLFKELDKSGEGKVEYEDIIRTILGTMSENRQRYVEAAFDIIDKDKDGIVDSEDISRVFEGWKHPEVKSGKHRAEDILHDVLEVLDNCTALHRGSRTDGRYTKEEFFKYFEYISACTPLDSDFENMFCTVWKVDKNALPPIVPKAAPVQEIAEPVKEPPKVVEEEKVVKPAAPIPPVEEAASEQDEYYFLYKSIQLDQYGNSRLHQVNHHKRWSKHYLYLPPQPHTIGQDRKHLQRRPYGRAKENGSFSYTEELRKVVQAFRYRARRDHFNQRVLSNRCR